MPKSNEKICNVDQLLRVRKSVRGRQSRLRKTRHRWSQYTESPIEEIGVFEDEIQKMEEALNSMSERIDNAKVIL